MSERLPNHYELSRSFWDFAFENPDKIRPTHIAIYFFAIEHCNRLGWKEKFGLPTSMVMDAIGIKSYHSYKSHFDDLCEWGCFKIVQLSKNQYSSNIIALSKNNKANDKALDKAIVKHSEKQLESIDQSTVQSTGESTSKSNDSINKPLTNNHKQITRPFPSESFSVAWDNWKIYKHQQHKFKYKSDISEQQGLNLLFKESHESEANAIQMLEYAMAKGYKGWIPMNDVNFYPQKTSQPAPTSKYNPADPKNQW